VLDSMATVAVAQFKADYALQSEGMLYAVRDSLLAGSDASALALLSAIVPADNQEQNLKTVWQIATQLRIMVDTSGVDTVKMDSNTAALLIPIAQQCYHAGGQAVIQARILLMGYKFWTIDQTLGLDDCMPSNKNGNSIPIGTMPEYDEDAENQLDQLVEDAAIQTIRMYPNPTDGLLYLEGENLRWNELRVQVLDAQGRNALQTRPDNGFVDLRSLAAGIYLVNISGPNGVLLTQKVVKN
jgi:Secretion system C-terminal sorting domain